MERAEAVLMVLGCRPQGWALVRDVEWRFLLRDSGRTPQSAWRAWEALSTLNEDPFYFRNLHIYTKVEKIVQRIHMYPSPTFKTHQRSAIFVSLPFYRTP